MADSPETTAFRLLERLPALAHADIQLQHRGRFCTTEFVVQVGATPYHLEIESGRVAALVKGPRLMHAWSFAVRASAEAWLKFWAPLPEPQWHDLFALTRHGQATVEGQILPLMQHLQYFKDLLALPRRA
jgi:hypothetical protein